MYFTFDSMPPHARLWIYQANRAFTSAEKEQIGGGLLTLCKQWAAHGTPLHTSFIIAYDQFVILSVDERQNGASGCSIDSSVHYLKSLQKELGLDFFDRTTVAFLQQEKINTHPLTELKTLFKNQTLSAQTIAFNNTVNTKVEWEKRWKVPVKDTWLARFLPKSAVPG